MSSRSRRWLWLLLLVPVVLGLARLRFDVEILNLLPGDSRVVQGLKLYQQNFANARELIVTVSAPDAEKTEAAARSIAAALRERKDLVAGALWQPPWLEHPGQAAEIVAFLWLNQPPGQIESLAQRLDSANLSNTLAEARERLATSLSPDDLAMSGYDPFGFMRLPDGVNGGAAPGGSGQEFFASADGTFRVLFVEAARDLGSYKDCVTWFDAVQALIASRLSSPEFPAGVAIQFTGRPAFVAEIGGGMEREMAGPSAGTLLVIALLFYFTHRCWRPLLWLVALLMLILAGALALGGLIYGALNVVSLGFASILLGLAEDFAIVLYQESRTHPGWSIRQIRHEAAPGILWSAVTTAGAFLLLNLSGLPGLGQLGTLVAIGVGLAAVVMLYAYLPPLLTSRNQTVPPSGATEPARSESAIHHGQSPGTIRRVSWTCTGFIALLGLLLLWRTPPRFDRSPDALRPKNSAAYAALAGIKSHLNRPQEPLWVLVTGNDENAISRRLAEVEPALQQAVSNGIISGFTLPAALWPDPALQSANRPTTLALARRGELLRQAALGAGFSTNAFGLAESILRTWEQAAASTNVFWPTNENSRWILEKLTARTTNGLLAIGLVHPPAGSALSVEARSILDAQLPQEGVWLSGWELLGPSIAESVRGELYRVVLPILGLVLVSLWLAFRDGREVILSLATLVFSGLGLHVVMALTGWSWNMMNLMALPLLLGMGVDFSIHMQLSLRRSGGDLGFTRRSVGRALLLAGSTTVAGFASLAFASNTGIASLGKVCAVGILCAMLTAVFLLPVWWARFAGRKTGTS